MTTKWETKPTTWRKCGGKGQRKTFTDATGQRVTAIVAPNNQDLPGKCRVDFYESGLGAIVALGGPCEDIPTGQTLVDQYLDMVTA